MLNVAGGTEQVTIRKVLIPPHIKDYSTDYNEARLKPGFSLVR